ncbi:MAG: sulfatase-like hydrolase/transferase [Bacteroidales bacterium]|nr:sulfatase-like hydrolase/transferase [Bacteroidales bacterium]
MKKEPFLFVLKAYLSYVLAFLAAKPVFMLLNAPKGISLGDYLGVLWHGLPMDLSTAGYFTLVPLLTTLFDTWVPLRKKGLQIFFGIYFGLTALLVSIGLCVDTVLYGFWGFKLDATVLNYIDSPKDAIASVSFWFIFLGFAAILVVAALLYLLLTKMASIKSDHAFRGKPNAHKWAPFLQTFVFLLLGGALFLIIRGGVGRSTMNIGKAFYSNNQFLNHSAVNPIFSFFYSSLKVQNFANEYLFFNGKQLAEESQILFPKEADVASAIPSPDAALLSSATPNIVLVLLEGFSAKFIGYLGAEKEIAPNLSRLMQEGICFSQCYANSFRTDRGTVAILSGYPAFPNLSVMKLPQKSRALPSLASVLKRAGYHTSFLYGGDINFTNMKSYLLSTGYDNVEGDTYFPVAAAHSNAWGANDHIVLDTFAQQILRATPPFFATCLTLSSHEPWEVPFGKIIGDKKANAFAYTDSCIGVFVKTLKGAPRWDSTLVVFVADHGVTYPESITEADPSKHHIPLFMIGGVCAQPLVVDKYCTQNDLAATLLSLLGLPHSDFHFSHNVLSPAYTYPYAVHTYSNGIAYIDSTGATVLDLTSMKPVTETPTPSLFRINRAKAYLQLAMRDLDKLGRNTK